MDGLTLGWLCFLGIPLLGLHLLSVTFTKALRTYSASRLEDLCARRGHPERAAEVDHFFDRTERATEILAVMSGLTLAALLGVLAGRIAGYLAVEAVVLIALGVGLVGYVLAGVSGRVFAEPVIDIIWPSARALRVATGPLTIGSRWLETIVESMASPSDAPRPASVEVEIPADADHPEDAEPELPEETRELLQRAVEMTRRDVSELMIPATQMVTLPANSTARHAAQVFRETGRSRIPLYGEHRDDIIGILYAKDLFSRMTEAKDPEGVVPEKLARPPFRVPETKNAYALLEEFRRERTQIAIAIDEYGGVAGLITLEDLVEELVGAIDDEHDVPTPPDPVVSLGGSRFEADATLSLEDLNARLGLRLPTDADFSTLGGFVFHALGHLPEPGATFRSEGIEFQIAEVSDHTIKRVRLDLQPAAMVESK